MINDLIKYFQNKKIIILGFGREGKSTYKLIRKYLKEQKLYIADANTELLNLNEFLKQDENLELKCGESYLENLEEYDLILKSPGISLAKIDISKFEKKIKSQLELLLEFFNIFTIGITGTKGKSTTSSLIYKVLQEQNVNSLLLGNIGVPVFDCIDTLEENTTIVLEMSSHQLEFMDLSPNIAILLNAYEEHLDHYKSFENYVEAKCNIFKNQKNNDYFLYNCDNDVLKNVVNNPIAKTYKVSLNQTHGAQVYLKNDIVYLNEKELYNLKEEKRNLMGDYNLNNIMFVLTVSEIMGLDLNKTIKTINNFKTLEHRLELVGNKDGVLYYDNSIATIPMATIEAVKALKNVDTLIIGGMDRGIDYSEFIDYLNKSDIKNIICMPKTGHDIAKKLSDDRKYIVETLEEAVDTAKKVTEKGKICLLSPAAASYGFFKNFEEKGNLYKKLVMQ